MKPELENEIIQIAPYMFKYNGWNDIQQSLLSFGFECNNGWFELIKKLVTDIKNLDTKQQVKVTQVKEKFGTLSFYIDWGTDEIYNLIHKADKDSATICETCGNQSELRSVGYWIYNFCDSCFANFKLDRNIAE